MFKLPLTCAAWTRGADSSALRDALDQDIRALDEKLLPLQQGLRQSSIALSHSLSSTILEAVLDGEYLTIRAGLFYTGIIAGCNCADDPGPADELNEYCEVSFRVALASTGAEVRLL